MKTVSVCLAIAAFCLCVLGLCIGSYIIAATNFVTMLANIVNWRILSRE